MLEGYDTVRLRFASDSRMPSVQITVPQSPLRKFSRRFEKMLQTQSPMIFDNDMQFPVAVFLAWTLDREIPNISDAVKKALHNHGRRCYQNEIPIEAYDNVALPFAGAELATLWRFGSYYDSADFQNGVMRNIVQAADDMDCIDLARTYLIWKTDMSKCHVAHRRLCLVLGRILAYKSYFCSVRETLISPPQFARFLAAQAARRSVRSWTPTIEITRTIQGI